MSHFHQYSFRNTLLILEQFPGASLVAGFNTWKKLGRSVNKGEHGIRILSPITYPASKNVPVRDKATGLYERTPDGSILKEQQEVRVAGFRPTSVFDISQTSGEPLPNLVNELQGDVDGFGRLFNALCEASGVQIAEDADLPPSAYGACDPGTGRIAIRQDISPAQKLKTLIHEIAHSMLHPPQNQYTRAEREVQAESVAYVVSAHFGLDTGDYSFGYLDSWMGSASDTELKSSLDLISRSASSIIAGAERILSKEPEAVKAPEPQKTPDAKRDQGYER